MLDEVDAAMEVSDVTLAGLPLSVVLAVFVAAAVKTRLESSSAVMGTFVTHDDVLVEWPLLKHMPRQMVLLAELSSSSPPFPPTQQAGIVS